jgi:hypothetical protein
MATTDYPRRGCAVVYGALYAAAVVIALLSGGGAGGGMAFVLPVLLGFPWTLILGVLVLVPQIPKPLAVLVLLAVPPAINLALILRTRGIVRAPREVPPEAHRPRENG